MITIVERDHWRVGPLDLESRPLEGEVEAGRAIPPGHLGVFEREGGVVRLRGEAGARVMILSGEPLNEPVVAYGPFVMNTDDEIRQAFDDYRSGRLTGG